MGQVSFPSSYKAKMFTRKMENLISWRLSDTYSIRCYWIFLQQLSCFSNAPWRFYANNPDALLSDRKLTEFLCFICNRILLASVYSYFTPIVSTVNSLFKPDGSPTFQSPRYQLSNHLSSTFTISTKIKLDDNNVSLGMKNSEKGYRHSTKTSVDVRRRWLATKVLFNTNCARISGWVDHLHRKG